MRKLPTPLVMPQPVTTAKAALCNPPTPLETPLARKERTPERKEYDRPGQHYARNLDDLSCFDSAYDFDDSATNILQCLNSGVVVDISGEGVDLTSGPLRSVLTSGPACPPLTSGLALSALTSGPADVSVDVGRAHVDGVSHVCTSEDHVAYNVCTSEDPVGGHVCTSEEQGVFNVCTSEEHVVGHVCSSDEQGVYNVCTSEENVDRGVCTSEEQVARGTGDLRERGSPSEETMQVDLTSGPASALTSGHFFSTSEEVERGHSDEIGAFAAFSKQVKLLSLNVQVNMTDAQLRRCLDLHAGDSTILCLQEFQRTLTAYNVDCYHVYVSDCEARGRCAIVFSKRLKWRILDHHSHLHFYMIVFEHVSVVSVHLKHLSEMYLRETLEALECYLQRADRLRRAPTIIMGDFNCGFAPSIPPHTGPFSGQQKHEDLFLALFARTQLVVANSFEDLGPTRFPPPRARQDPSAIDWFVLPTQLASTVTHMRYWRLPVDPGDHAFITKTDHVLLEATINLQLQQQAPRAQKRSSLPRGWTPPSDLDGTFQQHALGVTTTDSDAIAGYATALRTAIVEKGQQTTPQSFPFYDSSELLELLYCFDSSWYDLWKLCFDATYSYDDITSLFKIVRKL